MSPNGAAYFSPGCSAALGNQTIPPTKSPERATQDPNPHRASNDRLRPPHTQILRPQRGKTKSPLSRPHTTYFPYRTLGIPTTSHCQSATRTKNASAASAISARDILSWIVARARASAPPIDSPRRPRPSSLYRLHPRPSPPKTIQAGNSAGLSALLIRVTLLVYLPSSGLTISTIWSNAVGSAIAISDSALRFNAIPAAAAAGTKRL